LKTKGFSNHCPPVEAVFKRNLGPRDTKANVIGEGGELGAHQVLGPNPVPLVPYEQVLTG
jgi:hypothetical protein